MKDGQIRLGSITRLAAVLVIFVFAWHHFALSQQSGPPEKQKASSDTAKPGNKSTSTSVFDRPKNKADDGDFVIVPASREIMVAVTFPAGSPPTTAIEEGKVTVPVRVGFTTAIPALSKVHLRFAGTTEYGSVYELVSVELGKKIYKIETDQVPYSPSEMRFTLAKPLRIPR